jgi:hypothetical protein
LAPGRSACVRSFNGDSNAQFSVNSARKKMAPSSRRFSRAARNGDGVAGSIGHRWLDAESGVSARSAGRTVIGLSCFLTDADGVTTSIPFMGLMQGHHTMPKYVIERTMPGRPAFERRTARRLSGIERSSRDAVAARQVAAELRHRRQDLLCLRGREPRGNLAQPRFPIFSWTRTVGRSRIWVRWPRRDLRRRTFSLPKRQHDLQGGKQPHHRRPMITNPRPTTCRLAQSQGRHVWAGSGRPRRRALRLDWRLAAEGRTRRRHPVATHLALRRHP